MSPRRSDAALLWDILDAAKAIREFVLDKTYRDYETNPMLRAAVERKLEIIGEASNKISREFRHAHPEIPWRPMIAQRHEVIHEYFDLEDEAVWQVATTRIPEIVGLLENLIPPPPNVE
jgi:uncharacterized protein with HEPN domain